MERRKPTTFLPQAPAANMNQMRKGVIPGYESEIALFGGTGKPLPKRLGTTALTRMMKFHEEYRATDEVPYDMIAALKVSSTAELVAETKKVFSLHAVHKVQDKMNMRHASLAGCGVTVAFLAMIARMQAQQSEGVPFNGIAYADTAKKSVSTLLMIAATSREADGVVTENIMNWTIPEVTRMDDDTIYRELVLDETFFEFSSDGGVALKSDMATMKRIRTRGGGNFDFSSNKNEILFGCPFRSRIPLLYQALNKAMLANGIAEEVYTRSLISS